MLERCRDTQEHTWVEIQTNLPGQGTEQTSKSTALVYLQSERYTISRAVSRLFS